MAPIIEVQNLTYSYGSSVAVDSVSFNVEKGSLFAFLGPNGAGKSTTISVVTTMAPLQAGTVAYSIIDDDPHLVGEDDDAIRTKIGVVFQDGLLDAALTVRFNLRTRARLYGLSDVSFVAKSLHLDDIMDRKYGTLSGGQRRRVDIARALLASPEVLFLDEPTTGLDPQSRNLVWDTISELRQRLGLTVFLTSHYMEEAEQADQVVIIDHGSTIAAGTPTALRTAYSQDHLRLRGSPEIGDALLNATIPCTRNRDIINVPVESPAQALSILNTYTDLIDDFEMLHGTMDDVFLTLTGTSLRED